MTVQLYANNAKTTLAAPISSTATTITVAPGTGVLFPNPTTGQVFAVTLNSVSSPTVYEICYCTARSTDTLTVIRGQEGTTPTAFLLNDIVGNFDTAGVMANLIQPDQLQNGKYTYANAGGTANALTATITSNFTTLPDGFNFIIKAGATNTGSSTLVVTLGSTILASKPIVKGANIDLSAGDIAEAGYPISLTYSSTFDAYVMNNPSNGSSSSQFLASTNGYQILPSGIIIQWGQSGTSSGSTTVTFPLAFPNAVWSFQTTIFGNGGSGGWGTVEATSYGSLSSMTVYSAAFGSASDTPANGSFSFSWIAIGN